MLCIESGYEIPAFEECPVGGKGLTEQSQISSGFSAFVQLFQATDLFPLLSGTTDHLRSLN